MLMKKRRSRRHFTLVGADKFAVVATAFTPPIDSDDLNKRRAGIHVEAAVIVAGRKGPTGAPLEIREPR